MAVERDIVERLREAGFPMLREAAATIELLRAEVRAWRSAHEAWDGNPNPTAFMRRPHEQADATDAAGALGKENT